MKTIEEVRTSCYENITDLENLCNINMLEVFNKENILTFIDSYEQYLTLKPFITDMVNRLNNIHGHYQFMISVIMKEFIKSDEADIKNFIQTKLHKENEELLSKNKDVMERNTKLVYENKRLKVYKNNYNEDGSSKAIEENQKLKEDIKKLRKENLNLKIENSKYANLKHCVDALK